jgi:arylsulfatase
MRRLLPVLCLIGCCGLTSVAAEPLAGSRPNIMFIITDDQGFAPIGRHGHPWIHTPRLDHLFDTSLRFNRFLVSPTCSPTRAALMTGRHAMRNGITHTILERERLTLDAVTLPQVLKSAGYATGIFGKWHLGDEDPYQPGRRGFDETFIHGAGGIGQAYDCSCADAPGNRYVDPVIRHNGSFVQTRGFCTDVFFTAALGWIRECQRNDRRFFAYIATNAPHAPYVAPKKYTRRFTELGFCPNQAAFYGMIENIDDNIGRLLERLREWDLLPNTLIIFMSDNGMAEDGAGLDGTLLSQRTDGTELHPYNAGMKGYKNSVDEGGVRVPFFIRWDGRIEPGRDVDRLAAHIDVLPTLAELAGVPVPARQVEGRSLLALIMNVSAPWPDRYLINHQGRWPTGANPDDYQWRNFSIRNERFRFVDNQRLYDMQADYAQRVNVIEQHPEVVRAMRSAYAAWWKETRPMMINENAPLSPTRPFHEAYRRQAGTTGIPEWSPK